MYTQQQFGKELKEKIQNRESIYEIGNWAHNLYYERITEIDQQENFRRLLIKLGTITAGPEFEKSYEELNIIADKLIAGEDIRL